MKDKEQILNSQMTSHISSSWVSYGVPAVSMMENISYMMKLNGAVRYTL